MMPPSTHCTADVSPRCLWHEGRTGLEVSLCAWRPSTSLIRGACSCSLLLLLATTGIPAHEVSTRLVRTALGPAGPSGVEWDGMGVCSAFHEGTMADLSGRLKVLGDGLGATRPPQTLGGSCAVKPDTCPCPCTQAYITLSIPDRGHRGPAQSRRWSICAMLCSSDTTRRSDTFLALKLF